MSILQIDKRRRFFPRSDQCVTLHFQSRVLFHFTDNTDNCLGSVRKLDALSRASCKIDFLVGRLAVVGSEISSKVACVVISLKAGHNLRDHQGGGTLGE